MSISLIIGSTIFIGSLLLFLVLLKDMSKISDEEREAKQKEVDRELKEAADVWFKLGEKRRQNNKNEK